LIAKTFRPDRETSERAVAVTQWAGSGKGTETTTRDKKLVECERGRRVLALPAGGSRSRFICGYCPCTRFRSKSSRSEYEIGTTRRRRGLGFKHAQLVFQVHTYERGPTYAAQDVPVFTTAAGRSSWSARGERG